MLRAPSTISDSVFSSVNMGKSKTGTNIIKQFSPWKDPVKVTSFSNETKYGPVTIDSISLVQGDRVLLQGQTTSSENGIYTVMNTTWTRSHDMPDGSSIDGTVVYTKEGTVYNGLIFYTFSQGVVGTDDIAFNIMNNNDVSNIPVNYVVVRESNGFTGYSSLQYFEQPEFENATLVVGNTDAEFTVTPPETTGEEVPLDIITTERDLTLQCVVGDLTIQTGNLSTEKGTGGDITITTGDTMLYTPKYLLLDGARKGYISSTSTNKLTFQSKGIDSNYDHNIYFENSVNVSNSLERQLCYTSLASVVFKLNRVELLLAAVTVANLGVSPTINYSQGVITITDPSTLLANSFVDLTVSNTFSRATSIIKASVNTYQGTGFVSVNLVSKSDSVNFVLRLTNCSNVGLSASPLKIGFWIF